MIGEFEIIRKFFAPLADDASGAFGLLDDAAVIGENEFVVTKDLMVGGLHFLSDDPLDQVARKLLRVNLSDLAAKGAQPVGYFLGCVWPAKTKERDIDSFAKGLAADQELFRIRLYGGDTTRHVDVAAPLVLSATFFGKPPRQGIVRREGASLGDDLWVTGTIGDAGLGLAALAKPKSFPESALSHLIGRYRLPEPRLSLGGALPGLASAAIDVSDGLVADAGHIAKRAGLRAEIDVCAIPYSDAARAWLEKAANKDKAHARLATAGDDYEILFSAPTSRRRAVEMASKLTKTPVARIGTFVKGEGVALIGRDGEIEVSSAGFDHFARG